MHHNELFEYHLTLFDHDKEVVELLAFLSKSLPSLGFVQALLDFDIVLILHLHLDVLKSFL